MSTNIHSLCIVILSCWVAPVAHASIRLNHGTSVRQGLSSVGSAFNGSTALEQELPIAASAQLIIGLLTICMHGCMGMAMGMNIMTWYA